MKLYKRLALLRDAIRNCEKTGNTEWKERHWERMEGLVKQHMPSGSGFDAGTTLDEINFSRDVLRFTTSFHHMNPDGFYDGWTEHVVWVRPSLAFGFTLDIRGHDRNDIKEHIAEMFTYALDTEVE